MVLPYVLQNGTRWVPVDYFDSPMDDFSQYIHAWDLAYLRFCCMVRKLLYQEHTESK